MTKLNLKPEHLEKIKKLVNRENGSPYLFLGYSLDLETGRFRDLLGKDVLHRDWNIQVMSVLLVHYSQATQAPKTGNLVKLKDLPGGYAYDHAFTQRAIEPIAQTFGTNPAELVEVARILGGKPANFGDASIEVPALEGIPIVYILWGAHEFPASASILFDSSASSLLPTEDLAVLGELTTSRLKEASSTLETQKTPKPEA